MLLKKTYLIILLALMSSFHGLKAQQATAILDPSEIPLGGQARLQLNVVVPLNATIVWPPIADTLTSDIEVVRFGKPDTLSMGRESINISQTHILTAWKEGYFPIPPIQYKALVDSDTLIFFTEALLLEVQGVALDESEVPRDVKNILRIPLTLAEMLPWIAGFLALIVLGFFLYRYIINKRRDKPHDSIWNKPDIPAHIAALSSLESLRSKKLWQAGKTKAYYIALSNIVRMYLDKRFGMNAMEMTTSEIMQVAGKHLNDQGLMEGLLEILETADLVKFARYLPPAQLNEHCIDLAFELVDKTKPKDHSNA